MTGAGGAARPSREHRARHASETTDGIDRVGGEPAIEAGGSVGVMEWHKEFNDGGDPAMLVAVSERRRKNDTGGKPAIQELMAALDRCWETDAGGNPAVQPGSGAVVIAMAESVAKSVAGSVYLAESVVEFMVESVTKSVAGATAESVVKVMVESVTESVAGAMA
jgi:hypothetical protein